MLRFVGTDATGLPLKRKQSQRACESCRKRKKRCPHQRPTDQNEIDTSATGQSLSPHRVGDQVQRQTCSDAPSTPRLRAIHIPNPETAESMATAGGSTLDREEDEEDPDPRFVGELNPEGIFVAGASPAEATNTAAATSPEDTVGIWMPRNWANAARTVPEPLLSLLLPYLDGECRNALPKPSSYDFLYRLYLEEIHPILPVVNIEAYQRQQEKPKSLLKLAICLTTAGSPKAVSHLNGSPKEFTTHVTQLLRCVVDNGLVRDKQVVIQLLLLLSLCTQLSDDRHTSAEFASRAVSYIHTVGLHLETTNRGDNAYITRLFCCVFALDRLNAAVHGRPVLMHERDFGRDLHKSIEQQDSSFQLLLRVILLLDKVIALYRPSMVASDEATEVIQSLDQRFPAFEDLLGACGTSHVAASMVATIETLYHAVAMLSCRSQSLNELSRSSPAHTRQNLSAASIIAIAGNEYRGQLSTLPFVPYAISLALRVSYRELRLSKLSFTRTRARRQLLYVCILLREFSDIFSSSIHMAELAEQTVREMDKAYSTMAEQRKASLVAPLPGEQVQEHSLVHHDHQQHQPNTGIVAPDVFVPQATGEVSGLSINGLHMPPFDPSQFDFDLDIFDHFDSEFDIEAIDAALANSIGASVPTDMAQWDTF